MEMTKVELFRGYLRQHNLEMFIWDRWMDWRCEQAGVSGIKGTGNDKWHEVLYSMPEHFDWYPNTRDRVMEFSWKEGDEKKKETVPLTEFYDDEDEQPDLKMLWHADYWDGPLSGMAELDGEPLWFSVVYGNDEEDDYLDYRQYALYRMTDEERKIMFDRHRSFEENVGRHCNYGDRYKAYAIHDDEKPKWCPLWFYRKWRKIRFWYFYGWASKWSKEFNISKDREPVATYYDVQFDRRRNNVDTQV